MSNYKIPKQLFTEFLKVAKNNCDHEGHIETLAFLAGSREGDMLVASHLVFPKQVGTSSKVDDHGKFKYHN